MDFDEKLKTYIPSWILHTHTCYFVVLDLDFSYLFVNDLCKRKFYASNSQLIGSSVFHYVHPEDLSAFQQALDRCKFYHQISESLIIRKKDQDLQDYFYIDWELIRISDVSDDFQAIIGIGRDVTQQKKAEFEKSILLENFEKILSSTPGAVYEYYVPHHGKPYFSYMSPKTEEIIGVSPEPLKKDIEEGIKLTYPPDKESLMNSIQDAVNNLTDWKHEWRVVLGERTIWLEGNSTPQKLANGDIIFHGYLQDISQRKALEDQLALLSKVAERTLNLVIITDEERKIIWVNDAFVKKTGYTLEEVLGKNPGTFLQFAKTDPDTISKVSKALKNQQAIRFEILNKGKNGNIYWLDVDIQPLINHDGILTGFMAIEIDITHRKLAEKSLQDSEARLTATLNNTPSVAIQWYDEGGKVIYWNPASEKFYGWKPEEALGKTLDQLIYSPQVASDFLDFLQEIKSTGQIRNTYETQAHDREGNQLWILSSIFSIPLIDNQIGFACMDVDITERKKLEKDLIESEERYKSVVSAISEGLVVQDLSDKILMCNQAAADILGLTMNQLLGKDSYDPQWQALKEDDTPFKPEEHPTMITLRTGKGVDNVIMNVHTGTGERKHIVVNSRPVLNHKAEMYGAVASFKDITVQKIAEKTLKDSVSALKIIINAISHKNRGIYFENLTLCLNHITKSTFTFIGRFTSDHKTQIISVCHQNELIDNFVYNLNHTPCQRVFDGNVCIYPQDVAALFPQDQMLIDMGIVAYIGVPILDIEGKAVGLLVNLYDKPLLETELVESIFQLTAINIAAEFSRRTHEEELKQREELLNETGKIAKIGGWEFNILKNKVTWTEETYQIYEVDQSFLRSEENVFSYFHPVYRDEILKQYNHLLKTGQSLNIEIPLITARDKEIWVKVMANAHYKNGQIMKVLGIIQDISEQKQTEKHLKELNEKLTASEEELRQNLEDLYASQAKLEEQKFQLEQEINVRKLAEAKILAQNQILKEIAWQQSHKVRQPVANILGIIDLFKNEESMTEQEKTRFLDLLFKATHSLDMIIHEIVQKTNSLE